MAAPNLVVGDILEVRLEFANDVSGVGYNVLHYKVTNVTDVASGLPAAVGIPNDFALPVIGDDLFTAIAAKWKVPAAAECGMTGVTVQSIWPSPRSQPYLYTPGGGPIPGDQASDPLPLQDAPTLLKRTGIGQRWGLGRLFYYGLAENQQNTGEMSPAARTALNDLGAVLKASPVVTVAGYDITIQPGLAKLSRDGDIVTLDRWTPITNVVTSNLVIKTQRRRRPGKGI
jgi:hypothetical protein